MTGDLQIRRMQAEDLAEVLRIERENFSQPWSENGFRSSLQMENTCYLVAVLDGAIAGYYGYLRALDEADITNVAVDEGARRCGIARQMLTELMRTGYAEGIRDFTLEVRAGNTPAVRLYESLGFVTEGVRPRFYSLPTEDALIMWKRDQRI